ncbi:MAG TPA: condensation domain-containing protein, partial [Polyangiaceae bacterium]
MSLPLLLAELTRHDIHLAVEGDKLRVRAPEGAVSPQLRERLAQNKEALLRHLIAPDAPAYFAPSSGQRRLWFLDKIHPGRAEYNVVLGWRLEGPLDAPALRASLGELARRHESVRTRFEEIDGEPVAVVLPSSAIDLPILTGPEVPFAERESAVREILAREGGRPFELTSEALFRGTLFRLGDADHLLVLTFHHIVTDGASIAVLSSELAALYARHAGDASAALRAAPEKHFRDYARHEHTWLRSAEADRRRAFWHERLAGMPDLRLLAAPAVPGASRAKTSVTFRLPASLVSELKAWSQRESSTLFMTLFAAYAGLLHRYSGQTDFGVGAILANRGADAWREVTGFLANTIVLRCDLSGDPTFRELLGRVYRVVSEGIANQDLPYEEIVRASQRRRTTARDPLIQA